ncbi:hypothetical protein C8R42DRAFT_715231 [Lentinula raphanica]|nr:hypothetical protein C8R42DRAFT_715231 [Lentinula raphanica]
MSLPQLDSESQLDSQPQCLLKTEESNRSEPTEHGSLQKQISDIEQELSILQDRISDTQRQWHSIQEKYWKLTRSKERKNARLASLKNKLLPISQLPPEVFSLIFEEASRPDFLDTSVFDNSARTAAFILGVSRKWLRIAYATPRMWSKLYLKAGRHPNALLHDLSWVRHWFGRSAELPLDIHLVFDWFWSQKSDKFCQQKVKADELMHIILEFRGQIRWLILQAPFKILSALFELPPSSFPCLERVCIGVDADENHFRHYRTNEDVSTMEALKGAPNVQEVKLWATSSRVSVPIGQIFLPIEQLTSLQINALSTEKVFVGILSQCTNLISLDLCMLYQAVCYPIIKESIQISFPSLRSLSLDSHPESSLIRCITAPLVTDLHIRVVDHQDIQNLARDLVLFQARSMTNLTILSLTDLGYVADADGRLTKPEGLTAILGAFPTVSIFQLQGLLHADINPLLVCGLTYTEGSSVLLPKLTSFKLTREYIHLQKRSLTLPGLKDMILSRTRGSSGVPIDDECTSVARLCKVTLLGTDILEDDMEYVSNIPGLVVNWD